MIDETILQEYLDGALDEAQRRELEALLAESAEARAQLGEWQTFYAAFDSVADVPLTKDLAGNVVTQLEQETAVSPAPWLRWLLAAQVVLAGILIWQFLPLVQSWWGYGRLLWTLPELKIPSLTLWPVLLGWRTAVLTQINNLPAINLPLSQWLPVIGIVLIIWLAGNRLLFTSQDGGSHG